MIRSSLVMTLVMLLYCILNVCRYGWLLLFPFDSWGITFILAMLGRSKVPFIKFVSKYLHNKNKQTHESTTPIVVNNMGIFIVLVCVHAIPVLCTRA